MYEVNPTVVDLKLLFKDPFTTDTSLMDVGHIVPFWSSGKFPFNVMFPLYLLNSLLSYRNDFNSLFPGTTLMEGVFHPAER